jgi:hypothetical protein
MRADGRLTALHRRLETPAELNLPGPEELGQIFRRRVHGAAAGYRPSAGTASSAGQKTLLLIKAQGAFVLRIDEQGE